MNVRDICRCGHVRGSHLEHRGGCRNVGCPCTCWSPAYPVYDGPLPTGVVPVRDLSSGLTLVECSHRCEPSPAVRPEAPPDPGTRAGGGGGRCPFCLAEPWMHADRPVKRLVVAARELVLV